MANGLKAQEGRLEKKANKYSSTLQDAQILQSIKGQRVSPKPHIINSFSVD